MAASFVLAASAPVIAQGPPFGAPSPPGMAALRVLVTDALITQRPLAAAEVALTSAHVSRVATTAPDGRATFDTLPPGMYRVTFWHPDLDRIGVSGAVGIVTVSRDTSVALTTPPANDVRTALCGADAQGTVVTGTLTRNAQPLRAATVRLGWRRWTVAATGLETRAESLDTRTDSAGRYVVCGVPEDGPLTWRAVTRGAAPMLRSVAAAGRPVVEVSVAWRGDSVVVAGSALEPPAQWLAPERVVGIADAGPGGFDRRRLRAHGGQFLTAEDIMRRRPITTTDALRAVRGLTVLPACGGACTRIRVGRSIGARGVEADVCQPVMFMDGARVSEPRESDFTRVQAHPFDVLVSPAEIHGIEVYAGVATAPVEFASKGAECGVILVWTKRGGR
jgi:hypothetical protein